MNPAGGAPYPGMPNPAAGVPKPIPGAIPGVIPGVIPGTIPGAPKPAGDIIGAPRPIMEGAGAMGAMDGAIVGAKTPDAVLFCEVFIDARGTLF